MNQRQIQQMMQQAQKMQKDVEKSQSELEKKEYSATAGGVVEIKMSGVKKVTYLNIKEEIIDSDEKEMLEEMLTMAVNSVLEQIEADSNEKMNEITGGLPF